MMNAIIHVDGMTCKHCESAVKSAVKNVNGVKDVNVDLDTKKVKITFDKTLTTIEALKEVIEEQGYDVK